MELYDKLWALLIDRKVIKRKQLTRAYESAKAAGVSMETVLEESYRIPRSDLLAYLEIASPFPVIDLLQDPARPEIAQRVPEDISRRFSLLCVKEEGDKVVVAIADPTDSFALEYVRNRLTRDLDLRVPLLGDLRQGIEQAYAVPVQVVGRPKVHLPAELEFKAEVGAQFAAKEQKKVEAIALGDAPALQQAAASNEQVATTILKAGISLQQTLDHQALLRKLLTQAIYLVGCEATGLVVRDGQSFTLHLKHLQSEQIQNRGVNLSAASAVGFAWDKRLPQRVNEVEGEPELLGEVATRNMLVVPVLWQGEVLALLLAFNKRSSIFSEADLSNLEALATQAAVALNQARSVNALRQTNTGVSGLLVDLLESAGAVGHGHCQEVARFAVELGRAVELSASELSRLQSAALLHDIGKLKCWGPRRELHAEVGGEMLSRVPIFKDIVAAVRHHHERFEGGGFPAGLSGEQIPPLARIIALAEAWTEERDGSPEQFWRQSQGRFDPRLEQAFLRCAQAQSSAGIS